MNFPHQSLLKNDRDESVSPTKTLDLTASGNL